MKINVLRTDLAEAVMNVSRAVSSKASIPALEGILIKAYGEKITISGYDLEIGITTTIDATIQSQGEIVVSAKLFSEIVRKLPEEVVCIETDDRMITYITSGQAEYQIVGMSSVEYPDLPTFEENESISIKGEILKEMIKQTVYAVSDNNSKPIYTGSLFEMSENCFKIIAVDGYRMAIRQEEI
jgi:DNA polymerase-3 subunit beta